MNRIVNALALCAAAAIASPAQTFTMLHSFDGADGGGPYAGLVQATDGDLYGTTSVGGANYGAGTVFKITPGGKLTMLHSFDGTDGAYPGAGLVQSTNRAGNGDFYGTTEQGGANGYGTVFKITPDGRLTTLHGFDGTDGAYPYAGLVQTTDGNFYGTTEYAGAYNYGTVFKIAPDGRLTTLHSFGGAQDGAYPFAGLIQSTNRAADGNLYGTTDDGGAGGHGTVFKITLSGKLTTLHSFNGADGGYPRAALVLATDGNFYGTTEYGEYNGGRYYGTVFKITPGGKLTTLHTFDGKDGANPYAGLIQASDGNFYGTTLNGGSNGDGAIFKITPGGRLTTLYSFEHTQAYPFAGLVQATDGSFYGTTYEGGTNNCGGFFCGMIFRWSSGADLQVCRDGPAAHE
jgi:uncharacterized repeat protein (TIGR03803 family)